MKNYIKLILFVIITLVSLLTIRNFILKYEISLQDFYSMNFNLSNIFLFIIFLIISQILRAARLVSLSVNIRNVKFYEMFSLSCANSGLKYFMSSWIGDGILVLTLKKLLKINLGGGTSLVLIFRAFDLIVLFLFTILVLNFIIINLNVSLYNFVFNLIFYIIGFIIVLIFSFYLIKTIKLPITIKILNLISNQIIDAIMIFKKNFILKTIITNFILTFLLWGALSIAIYYLSKSIGINIGYEGVLLILVGSFSIRLIPVQGFGNIGSHQIVWIFCLTYLGFSKQDALFYAVISHIIYLIGMFIILLLGSLLLLKLNLIEK